MTQPTVYLAKLVSGEMVMFQGLDGGEEFKVTEPVIVFTPDPRSGSLIPSQWVVGVEEDVTIQKQHMMYVTTAMGAGMKSIYMQVLQELKSAEAKVEGGEDTRTLEQIKADARKSGLVV